MTKPYRKPIKLFGIPGGAGGKGVWGIPGSELLETYEDMNDPNYDAECLTNGDIELKEVIPEIDFHELQVRTVLFKGTCRSDITMTGMQLVLVWF